MSYFAFGLVTLDDHGRNNRKRLTLTMQRCAHAAGFSVVLAEEREPTILAEMRGRFAPDVAIPFFCVDEPMADTSDALISPHAGGLERAARGLAAIADWVSCTLRQPGIDDLKIWFTEGYDDTFERWTCPPEQLAALLMRRLNEENDVPSMQVTVSSRLGVRR